MGVSRISRREFMQAGAAASAAMLLSDVLRAAEAKGAKPNIVFILADDMGYGDLGCQNPASKIPTPNLDRLASQGMRFTDAHTPSGVCTPTRYALLTGRYCWRSRLKTGVLGGFSPRLIEQGRQTVASLLKQAGYQTACIGKWHLGVDWATRKPQNFGDGIGPKGDITQIDYSQPVANGPTTLGFDYFYGFSGSADMPPFIYIENDRTVGVPTVVKTFNRRGPAHKDFEQVEAMPTITAKAEDYIREHAKSPAPFFLYFPLTAPHEPIVPAAEFRGKSQAGAYGDFVMQVDDTVRRVVEAIDKAGIAENTLVIFTSDNGPEKTAYARAEQFRHFSMGDWRGLKRDTWEGGHRVPFLVRWPGQVPAGATSSEIIDLADFFATAAAVSGMKVPENAGEDSYNILPALLGQKLEKPIREATVYHAMNGHLAIRQGPWVFIDAKSGDGNKEPEWLKKERQYQPHDFPGELYNLQDDPAERTNLYGREPEKAKQLKALLDKYRAEGHSAPRA